MIKVNHISLIKDLLALNADKDFAIIRKFNCVRDEVNQDLPQTSNIAQNCFWRIGRNQIAQFQSLARCVVGQQINGRLNTFREVKGLGL